MKQFLIIVGAGALAYYLWKMSETSNAAAIKGSVQKNGNLPFSTRARIANPKKPIIILQVDKPANDLPFLFDDNMIACYNTNYDATVGTVVYDVVKNEN